MCEITAVTSGKGGSGKTMVASNLAAVLAMQGKRVLLIDMNAGFRNLDICLGMESQIIFDIADVIEGICPIRRALIRDSRFEALYLLSASQNPEKGNIQPPHMKALCKKLSLKFDHIIIDVPGGLGLEWKTAVAAANHAIVVMTQDYVAIRDSDTLDMKLQESGVRNRCVLLNRMRGDYAANKNLPSLGEIADALRMRIIGIIQEDDNIHIAMNNGIPVVCKNENYIRTNFLNIEQRLFFGECYE